MIRHRGKTVTGPDAYVGALLAYDLAPEVLDASQDLSGSHGGILPNERSRVNMLDSTPSAPLRLFVGQRDAPAVGRPGGRGPKNLVARAETLVSRRYGQNQRARRAALYVRQGPYRGHHEITLANIGREVM